MAEFSSITSILNSFTGPIIGFIGFALGIRFSKDNKDRQLVRGVYETAFEGFKAYSESFERKILVHWENYSENQRYLPPIKKLQYTGKLSLIDPRIAEKLIKAEDSFLKSNSDLRVSSAKNLNPKITELINDANQNSSKKRSRLLDKSVRTMVSFSTTEIYFWTPEDIRKLRERITSARNKENVTAGIRISLITTSKNDFSIEIFEYDIGERKLEDFFDSIVSTARNLEAPCKAAEIVSKAHENVLKMLDTVSERVREPFPFWDTVLRAITDPIRR